jgi:hypothetical protein
MDLHSRNCHRDWGVAKLMMQQSQFPNAGNSFLLKTAYCPRPFQYIYLEQKLQILPENTPQQLNPNLTSVLSE